MTGHGTIYVALTWRVIGTNYVVFSSITEGGRWFALEVARALIPRRAQPPETLDGAWFYQHIGQDVYLDLKWEHRLVSGAWAVTKIRHRNSPAVRLLDTESIPVV